MRKFQAAGFAVVIPDYVAMFGDPFGHPIAVGENAWSKEWVVFSCNLAKESYARLMWLMHLYLGRFHSLHHGSPVVRDAVIFGTSI